MGGPNERKTTGSHLSLSVRVSPLTQCMDGYCVGLRKTSGSTYLPCSPLTPLSETRAMHGIVSIVHGIPMSKIDVTLSLKAFDFEPQVI